MITLLRQFAGCESGSAAVEYGLIIALVAAVSIGTIKTIGTNLAAKWSTVDSSLAAAAP